MKDLSMTEINTSNSLHFAPSCEPDETTSSSCDNNESCSPSKIFKRHHSLAELTSVAVSEKQALERENSHASDSSETSSQGFESSEHKAKESAILYNAIQNHQIDVQNTPTKFVGLNNNDPLTPTANLKMLMSVVSPAIRDREEKKKDLFVYTDSVDNVAEEVIIEKPVIYSRKDKSLGLLCQRFLTKFPENPGDNPIEICLDEVSKDLKVERRRVYDIVNVLESVEVLSRVAKNRYLWHGKTRIAQTLGRLKVLSRSHDNSASMIRKGKENIGQTINKPPNTKMKRHFSCGDMPRRRSLGSTNSLPLKEINLTKEDERRRIKAAIESSDHCRKDKSLGVLSQKFLIMFLMSKGGVVTLEDAANVLLEEQDDGNVKYKTKVRRLYDIANILSSLQLIEKVHIRRPNGKKPGFKWIGIDIDNLPENTLPTGPVPTFKTKHSLLPEPTLFIDNKCVVGHALLQPSSTTDTVRWSKSASCSASLGSRRPSDSCLLNGTLSESGESGRSDGFLVHEFAASPVNVLGHDVTNTYSPTDITFREEIQRLQEKFPNRMSQLLAVLPFSPSQMGNNNKTSRRNLFNQCRNHEPGEPNPKRLRANSVSDLVKAAESSAFLDEQIPVTGVEEIVSTELTTNNEGDPDKVDYATKFMHSTNSPFKIMHSCAYRQPNEMAINTSDQACNAIIQQRQKQQVLLQEQRQNHHRVETQWRHMVGPSGSRMVQLVDQAVSPIPPGKLIPRASIAVQASLIKDISPLKPLMYVHHRIPSPWKLPSPSSAPPAPPSTPELPNELSIGPFQSQANAAIFLQSISPYPVSQSCGTSPVAAPFSGARLFFPPSPPTNLVLSQGNLIYNVNQIMTTMTPSPMDHHSNSCPSSINNSPTLGGPGRSLTPGVVIQGNQTTGALVIPHQTPQIISRPATVRQNVTPQIPGGYVGGKQPCIMNNAGRLGATPSNDDETLKDNVSRRLCLTNEHS